MAYQKNNQKKGFTLIEAVVVMAVISILAGIISVSYGAQRARNDVEASAREFASILKLAQNYALTGKQMSDTTTTCQFIVTASGSTYSLWYRIKSAESCTADPALIATYNLRPGVGISTAGATFTLPWAGTGLANGTYTTFTLSKSSATRFVCLYASGAITEQSTICT